MSVQVPKEAFEFFKKLENNNNRDWFNDHKTEFKDIETKVKALSRTRSFSIYSNRQV